MALGSPGVEVQVIDESFYTPAAPGTVPMIFISTAQDKSNAAGTGTAQGTTAANAGKVWVITSQRDLVDTFGVPNFVTDANGNSVHGDERNEYGLQAAYSVLGASSRAYVVRADIDLNELAPSATAPSGTPSAGQYWIDTDAGVYGINEWNATTQKFTVRTPLIIDGTNVTTDATNLVPNLGFGKIGDYALVITADNVNKLWYKKSDNTWVEVKDGFDGKRLVVAPHTNYPLYNASTATGSIWVKTTAVGGGANWNVKYYNGSTQSWSVKTSPIYTSTREALEKLDYTGGGKNIPVGNVFIESNYDHATTATASFKVWRRSVSSPTSVSFVATTATSAFPSVFYIRESSVNTSSWGVVKTVTVQASTSSSIASQIPAAVSAAALTNVSASFDSETGILTFSHTLGGDFQVRDSSPTGPLYTIGLTALSTSTTNNLYMGPVHEESAFASGSGPVYLASNWKPLTYVAKTSAPTNVPSDGTLWFANNFDVDIMVLNGGSWKGYRNVNPNTDPNGPIVSATEPESQSDGTPLVDKDIWVSTDNPEEYGQNIYVYDASITVGSKWVLQDVRDQETPDGWVFADARWATNGATLDPSAIKNLLLSNYVDPDTPDPALYPNGIKLWNTRRSGNNVKKYISGYINTAANEGINIRNGEDMISLGYKTDRWVSQENRNEDGSGRFGRKSQRAVVSAAMKSMIDSNTALRDNDTLVFNLLAAPGYPEAIQNMITLNADRGYTAFVVGDTPFRLPANGTDLTNWGSNTALATDNGEDGAVSYDDYGCMAMFYPSGFTNDLRGNNIVVPPSHMMLRTIINSDAKSYQWFAPAGTRRGGIDNATSVGYIDAASGEFRTVALHEGLRDVLQASTVKINPIATLPGIGLVNFGQKTRYRADSALDRMNVARLVCFLRRQLSILSKPFLFEPNDDQTRREIKAAADSLLLELVGQRALYDFLTVCDSTNNTPARIDRNELWLDVAIEPVKAVEFIYIPLRIKNTGEISSGL